MPPGCNAIVRATLVGRTITPMDSADLLCGVTAEQLAEMTGVDLTTARRWKRTAKVPEPARRLLALHITGDLSALSPLWESWTLRNGRLHGPDGFSFEPREILALPFVQRLVSSYQAEQRCERQGDWISGKWESQRVEAKDARTAALFSTPPPPAEDYSYLAPGISRRRARRR